MHYIAQCLPHYPFSTDRTKTTSLFLNIIIFKDATAEQIASRYNTCKTKPSLCPHLFRSTCRFAFCSLLGSISFFKCTIITELQNEVQSAFWKATKNKKKIRFTVYPSARSWSALNNELILYVAGFNPGSRWWRLWWCRCCCCCCKARLLTLH